MKRKVMTILCFITGFLLCSYPLVSNRIEQERQQKVITTYENGVGENERYGIRVARSTKI
ncbi:MAG: hypothetical protein ACLTKE_12380 [Coprococcus sp.]